MPKPKNKFDQAHLRNQQKYQKQIDEIYRLAVNEAAAIGVSIKDFDPDTIFSFSDFPQASKRADELVADLRKQIDTCLVNGIRSEWTLANNKNNELCNQVFGENVGKLSREEYRRYYSTNGKALDAFLERKEAGLNLSDRVWRYSDAFRNEIEMGLDLGIREGLDAAEMARDLQTYLKHPDKLFRRVRDEHGVLHLSKAASQFHPGRGVYRSSYLNARRLAATETNIAYRTADHLRWQNMDFVVGIKIQLSNNHNCKGVPAGMFFDICDELKGNYPKDFKFTGWHPHCRCYATPILKTPEEIAADNERIMRGEEPLEQSIEDLEFKDNSRSVIDKISAPYDKMINSDYRVGMPLDDYASGSDEINDVARFGKLRRKSYNSNNVEDWKDAIKSLDDVMDMLPRLPQNVDLFRASSTLADFPIKGKSIEEINKHIGEKFVDKGFTSFSFSRKYVEKASDADDFIIVFKAKKGLKGASLANTSSFNAVERQEEFLVARNTEYKILGAKEVKGKKYLFVGEGDEAVASTKRVKKVPNNFNKWIENNKERIGQARSLPYFISDNAAMIDGGAKGKVNTTAKVVRTAAKKREELSVETFGMRFDEGEGMTIEFLTLNSEEWGEFQDQIIQLENIHSVQDQVYAPAVKKYMDGKTYLNEEGLPKVAYINGEYYVVDGNHRIAAAIANGEKEVKVALGFLPETDFIALTSLAEENPSLWGQIVTGNVKYGGVESIIGVIEGARRKPPKIGVK